MRRAANPLWVIAALCCLLAAQFHLSVEFDPCLLTGHSEPGGQHGYCGHGCPASFVNSWLGTPETPLVLGLRFVSCAKCEFPASRSDTHRRETLSSRAPPLA